SFLPRETKKKSLAVYALRFKTRGRFPPCSNTFHGRDSIGACNYCVAFVGAKHNGFVSVMDDDDGFGGLMCAERGRRGIDTPRDWPGADKWGQGRIPLAPNGVRGPKLHWPYQIETYACSGRFRFPAL